jgi:mRNA interferase HigB
MRIINTEELKEFANQYAQARKPLIRWIDITTRSSWRDFKDVRQTFNSADYVKGFVVFDIGGNLYRLIAKVKYQDRIVVIENIFTHKEYDKWRP